MCQNRAPIGPTVILKMLKMLKMLKKQKAKSKKQKAKSKKQKAKMREVIKSCDTKSN
mgnify:CR=1 FL=1